MRCHFAISICKANLLTAWLPLIGLPPRHQHPDNAIGGHLRLHFKRLDLWSLLVVWSDCESADCCPAIESCPRWQHAWHAPSPAVVDELAVCIPIVCPHLAQLSANLCLSTILSWAPHLGFNCRWTICMARTACLLTVLLSRLNYDHWYLIHGPDIAQAIGNGMTATEFWSGFNLQAWNVEELSKAASFLHNENSCAIQLDKESPSSPVSSPQTSYICVSYKISSVSFRFILKAEQSVTETKGWKCYPI